MVSVARSNVKLFGFAHVKLLNISRYSEDIRNLFYNTPAIRAAGSRSQKAGVRELCASELSYFRRSYAK